MKTKQFGVAVCLALSACAVVPMGQKVKEPFQGSSYESNNRFFRAVGKGQSSADNVALGKADIEAKAQLAGLVNTTVKQVADQYPGSDRKRKGSGRRR